MPTIARPGEALLMPVVCGPSVISQKGMVAEVKEVLPMTSLGPTSMASLAALSFQARALKSQSLGCS